MQQSQAVQTTIAKAVVPTASQRLLPKIGLALTIAAMSAPAFAEAPDVSSIVTVITGCVATISAIGLAVLSLVVTAKVFKWVKTAM